MLEERAKLSKEEHKAYSQSIYHRLIGSKFYENSNTIMTFISFKDEVDTHRLIKNSLKIGKRVTVPITYPETKEIKPSEILSFDELEIGFYNILTPKKDYIRLIKPEEIDLILVPGLAFDRRGYRVGYGGGYYDRFLEKYPNITTIGICFDLQIIEELPKEDFDIPVDFIITEKEFIDPAKENSF